MPTVNRSIRELLSCWMRHVCLIRPITFELVEAACSEKKMNFMVVKFIDNLKEYGKIP